MLDIFAGLLAQATTHAATLPTTVPIPPVDPTGTLGERAQSAVGFVMLVGLTVLIGWVRNRGAFRMPWRATIWGTGLMVVFTLFVFRFPAVLVWVNDMIDALLGFTRDGARIVFGQLANHFMKAEDGTITAHGADFAFFVAPTIVFFSALTAVCYHCGVMQYVTQGIAWVMSKSMKTSGAETLSAAANIFVGQTEAPLMVKPFLEAATNSELMAVMVAGFANIASGVLGIYSDWLGPYVANAGGHLAAACFISCPASLFVSKIIVPETGAPRTMAGVSFEVKRIDANLIDAAARGTSEGVTLAINVGAMLISFTALVAMLNALLGWGSAKCGLMPEGHPVTLEWTLGRLFAPLAWTCGVPWGECNTVGSLLGVKTVLNELIAYSNMKDMFHANRDVLSPRSALITTYALCGFANFASIGIQVGGIATMVPDRRADLAKLGLMAMLAGGISTLMAAAMVGVIK